MSNKSFFALSTLMLLLAGCGSAEPSQVPAASRAYGRVAFTSTVLSRTIQYAASEVKSAKVFLLDPDNLTVSSGVILADADHWDGGTFTCAIDNVPPGNYKASIEFYNNLDPATSTKIGTGTSLDGNGADAGDFSVAVLQTATVGFGIVTLDLNPVGNANASVYVDGAADEAITFQ